MGKIYRVRLKKYNQDHEADGRFGGPGTSHQPTGNPRGRPSLGQVAGAVGTATAGAGVGGYVGARAGKALGAAAGGALGAAVPVLGEMGVSEAVGAKVGSIAGDVLGGLVGDYVGTKIGSALLGIKELKDQHAIGEGAAIGQSAAGWGAYAASRLLPGGSAARSLFDVGSTQAAAHATMTGLEAGGGVAGGLIGGAAGRGNPKARSARGALARGAGAISTGEKVASRLKKHMLDKPPASYDGSMTSMATASIPNLFGPRAWSKVSGTKFGSYIRNRVKCVAEKMDDAAEGHGVDLTPAKPEDVALHQHNMQMQQQDVLQQQKDHELQMAQAQAKPQPGGSPFGKRLRKAAPMLMRGPNDAVLTNAYRTGGAANWDFLRRMQESDRKSRNVSLTRALAQPKIENLARAPSEDENMYRARIQRVMQASVAMADRYRPQLFNGGASQAGLSGLPGDATATRYSVRKIGQKNGQGWSIQSEIAKEFNTVDNLKQGLVYGWASIIEKDGVMVTDHEGDRIEPDELTKGAHDFIKNSRQGGVLHDEYGNHIGHVVESVVFTKELQKALNIDLKKIGWLIGYQITDPRVKLLVKGGLLKSFSIGGKGRRVPVHE